jgi:flagellar basal body rod protein FlgF
MALMITGADGKEVQYTGGSNLSSRTGNREDDSMLSAVEREMARLEAEQKRKEREAYQESIVEERRLQSNVNQSKRPVKMSAFERQMEMEMQRIEKLNRERLKSGADFI